MTRGKHRVSLDLPKAKHAAPIPMGARVGNMIFSSGIMGQNPETGELPGDAALQTKFAFENMKAMLELGGAKLGDVAKMTVFLADNAYRSHINEHWLRFFPDEHDRPARHTIIHPLPAGMLVQLEIFAVCEE